MRVHLRKALFVAVAVPFLLVGCSKQQQGGQGPAAEVSIVTLAPERLAMTNELPGRLEANRVAQVRARVAGIVLKRNFTEGSEVKAGQLLFRIDPATYLAALNSAKATLARAEANLQQAALKAERYAPLVKINAISKQEYDETVAAKLQAAADVAAGKAAVTTASLNLGYASVTAPISGRIGRAMVTEGALVGQGEVTQLALIQQIDSLYVNITQSSAELSQLQQAMMKGQLKMVSDKEAKVTLLLEDGSVYAHEGRLLFSDITVDETTGSVTMRAKFPNPERLLMPGMFVRARLQQAVNENALAVPQQAVQRTNEGATVMVVGEGDKVETRVVTTLASNGDKWVIGSGLKVGDRVIVEGLQKIRPGIPVKPILWKKTDNAEAAPAAAGQAASAKPAAASSASASASASQPAHK